jgi:hypothetical protein
MIPSSSSSPPVDPEAVYVVLASFKIVWKHFLFLQAAGTEAAAEVPNVETLKHWVFLIP